jgi:hypothetical protein
MGAKRGDGLVDSFLATMANAPDPLLDVDFAGKAQPCLPLRLPGDFRVRAELTAQHPHVSSRRRERSAIE